MPSLHTIPSAWCTAPSAYERSVTGQSTSPAQTSTSTRPVGPSPRRRSTLARPHPGARSGRDPRPVDPAGVGRARQGGEHLCPPGTARVGAPPAGRPPRPPRHARPGTPRQAGRQGSQVGGALRAADADDAGAIGAQAEPQGWTLGRTAHDVFAAPQDADGLAGLVRESPRASPERGCAPSRRKRLRCRAARRGGRRACSSWRRARRRQARPRWSAA